jgi:3-isopropylmalate/(R)-2-methylmalate dehydratase small subunit
MTHTMAPFTAITSPAVLFPVDDIDTDRIIPARFLTTVERTGLGAHLFADLRGDRGAAQGAFPSDPAATRGRRVLVAGVNFGCGSSREHAPWALLDFGFRVVIAGSFADIFRANALKTGLLPVALERDDHARLVDVLATRPDLPVTVDLAGRSVVIDDGPPLPFTIDPFDARCLLDGTDQLGVLLQADAEISAFEHAYPSPVRTA